MSISLPSKEIYAVDVPEVERFEGTFHYNFFAPDESTSDVGGIPTKFLKRNSAEIDASFIQYSLTRAPRLVSFKWKVPRLANPGGLSFEGYTDGPFKTKSQNGSLITSNLDKIVMEDQFSTNNYVALNFHDGDIDEKLHYYVSGSSEIRSLADSSDGNNSLYKAAQKLVTQTPSSVTSQFLYKVLANQTLANGSRFFSDDGSRVFNEYFRELKSVSTNVQVNSKLLHDVVNNVISDPTTPYATDLKDTFAASKQIKTEAIRNAAGGLSEDDYKTFIPYIDVSVQKGVSGQNYISSEIVGYIIDRFELDGNGVSKQLDPIIVEKASIGTTADYKVKYNSRYAYCIRTIALFTLPAINDDTNEVALIRTLVSSRPSNMVYVETIETTAPPVPSDLNFTWNYERINPLTAEYDKDGNAYQGTGIAGSLLVHWTFPANSQRDIKRFQVFRRKDTDSPFELIKEYNFDDSLVKFPSKENPDPKNVENVTSPVTFYYDDDFQVGNHNFHNQQMSKFVGLEISPFSSAYIYAVASIDAHGYTSPLSAQYLVWFDPFKNKLQKHLVSHSGAPKPYPNLFLNADTFVDTMRVSGAHSKKLRVYFTPECYYVLDEKDRPQKVISTKQDGKSYKLQFINIDNQKSAVVNIALDDKVGLDKQADGTSLL